METNHRRRVLLFSIDVALSLLAKSKYEKNVYAILKVAYQGTITTKKFVCKPSVVESIVHSSRIDLSGTPCIRYSSLSFKDGTESAFCSNMLTGAVKILFRPPYIGLMGTANLYFYYRLKDFCCNMSTFFNNTSHFKKFVSC